MTVGKKISAVMEFDLGIPGGIATLGEDGKLISSQLPEQVTDILGIDKKAEQALSKAEQALKEAGKRAALFSCTLVESDWINRPEGGWYQTVPCGGITATTTGSSPFVLPTFDQKIDEDNNDALMLIAGGETGDGTVTFICLEDKPEIDLTLYFLGVENNG